MKWVLGAAGRAGERVGVLEAGAGAWSTPLPLLTTRGGLVPHLTRETLALLPWSQGAPVIAPLQHHIGQVGVGFCFLLWSG